MIETPLPNSSSTHSQRTLQLAWLLAITLIVVLWGGTAEALRHRQNLLRIEQQTDQQHWLQQAQRAVDFSLRTLVKDISLFSQGSSGLSRSATELSQLRDGLLWQVSADKVLQQHGQAQPLDTAAIENVRQLLQVGPDANRLQIYPANRSASGKHSEWLQVVVMECNDSHCPSALTGFVMLSQLLDEDLLAQHPAIAITDENRNILAGNPHADSHGDSDFSAFQYIRLNQVNLQLAMQLHGQHIIRSFNAFTLGTLATSMLLTALLLLFMTRVSRLLKRQSDEHQQLAHMQQMLSLTNTSLREKMRKLIDEQRDQQTLIETVQVGVLIVDSSDLSILTCNDVAARMTGMSRQLLQQQPLPELFVHSARCHELLAVLQEQQIVTDREAQLKSRNEKLCWSMTSMRYMQFRERHAIAVSLIDISERIAHAQRLQDEKLATERALAQLQATQHELYQRATTDELTALPNRRHFMSYAGKCLDKARIDASTISMALIDLDHFKQINDRFGHPAGDAVLIFFARHLATSLPVVAMPGRMGGEEFAVILPDTSQQEAHVLIDRIRSELENKSCQTEQHTLSITFSAGIASSTPQNALDLDSLLKCADQAMYAAKAHGRNRVESHQEPGTQPSAL